MADMKLKDTILSKLETVKYKIEWKQFKTKSKRSLKHTNIIRKSRNVIIWGWEDISTKLSDEKKTPCLNFDLGW